MNNTMNAGIRRFSLPGRLRRAVMRPPAMAVLVLSALVLAVPSAGRASAETPPPTFGLQLCEHIHYQGECRTFSPGEYGSLPFYNFNDRASSLRIGNPWIAAVYEHIWYGGRCLTVTADIEDLRRYSFNDTITSMLVGRGCVASPPGWGVQLCQHINHQGYCQTYTASNPDLRSHQPTHDSASSLRVASGSVAAVYERINYQGRCQTVAGGTAIADLRGTIIGNDTISSIRVGVRCS